VSHPPLAQPQGKHHRPAAAASSAIPSPASSTPAAASAASSSGSAATAYSNPLRAVSGLIPERVDMGVDFGGTGPVYALGDAVITNATGVSSGWPGGGWITYRLTDGPDAGLVVYLAEDVRPTVTVGQTVTSGTVIGTMYSGGDGIETGWAMADGASSESELPAAGDIGGAGPFPTMVGLSFENLLRSVGVPASSDAGSSGYGALPAGYPAT
jgi:murein DD-endopeptidase MepM/ murein hydrolase activator NlpD